MTRAEAIKRFQRMKKILSIPNSDAARTIEAIDMAIEALEQEPKWIPVSERLPKIGEIVLITDTLWNGRRVSIDWRNDEQWVRNGQYVIAWQPLPEPYEESDGE